MLNKILGSVVVVLLKVFQLAVQRNAEFGFILIPNLIDTTGDYNANLKQLFDAFLFLIVKIILFNLGIKAIVELAKCETSAGAAIIIGLALKYPHDLCGHNHTSLKGALVFIDQQVE